MKKTASEDFQMSTNSLMVVGQPGRFERAATQFVRPMPPSPMVLQRLMQTLSALNNKVDALAKRPAQIVEVRPIEAKEVKADSPAQATQKKLDRKRLLDFFD